MRSLGASSARGLRSPSSPIGDLAAISPIVDSCRVCEACVEGEEQLCEKGYTLTYASFDRTTGGLTYGGYANNYVVDERFALRLQAEVDLAATAPLLCAGITTYSPLRHWQIGPHSTIGIVGLGGLGHVAVKISHALGATVTVFTSSPGKVEDARRFGARDVVLSTDVDELKRHRGRFDLVLDTVPVDHDINALIATLTRDGTLCLVGIPQRPLSVAAFGLIRGRKRLAGSEIGGLRETQEMLDFCADHGIVAEIELIAPDVIGAAYERLLNKDVKYRFVLDTAMIR